MSEGSTSRVMGRGCGGGCALDRDVEIIGTMVLNHDHRRRHGPERWLFPAESSSRESEPPSSSQVCWRPHQQRCQKAVWDTACERAQCSSLVMITSRSSNSLPFPLFSQLSNKSSMVWMPLGSYLSSPVLQLFPLQIKVCTSSSSLKCQAL